MKRVQALIALLAITSPAYAQQGTVREAVGPWAYGEDKDVITDQTGAGAGVNSLDGQATLGLKCDPSAEGNPMTFVLRTPRQVLLPQNPLVTIRVDGSAPISTYWYRVTPDAAVMYPGREVRKWSKALAEGNTLLLRVLDIDDQATDLRFHLAKPKEVFRRVYEKCGSKADHLSR